MIDFSCQDKTDELCATAREHLQQSTIIVVGLGALGTSATNALVRSGCEQLILIDDDTIEATNLPRQSLYTETDIGKKKVDVAKERLQAINNKITITIINQRLTKKNVDILYKATIILDCTDNLTTRRIIDDYCYQEKKPWVHAAVIKATGEVMTILPGNKRYNDVIKNKNVEQDCNEQGILSTAAITTGTFQATIALRVLTGQTKDLKNKLYRMNAWQGTIDTYEL